ncbi:MAG: hypothetical protein K8W52_13430 [Deltaproteobacteria bacterium]|nr:hypothetical protein [Deltaproteobacteria bacterium]
MKRSLALLVLAAACGGKAHPGTATSGGACPAADRVVIAEWYDAGGFGDETYGGGMTAAGWRVFLSNKSDTGEGTESPGGNRYEPLSLDAARAAGLTPPPAVWIYVDGAAPCKATVTGGFRMQRDEGPRSTQLGLETTGCPKPAGADGATLAYGLAGDEDFSACTWEQPTKVAERGGAEAGDGNEPWAPSATSTPLPAEVTPLLKPHACAEPACVPLWSAVKLPSGSAYGVTRTWMKPVAGQGTCEIEHDDEVEVFVDAGKGLAPITWAEEYRYVATFEGVFRDAGGPRLLVLDNVGTFDVYTVAPTGTTRARSVRWYDNNEEDSHYHSMAPYCGP